MWFFQHKNLLNGSFSWIVVSITTFMHIIVLIGLFFFYRSADEYFTVLIDRAMLTDLSIILSPALVKTNHKTMPTLSSSKKGLVANNTNNAMKKPSSVEKSKSQKKQGPVLAAAKNMPAKKTVSPTVAKTVPDKTVKKLESPVKSNVSSNKKNAQKNVKQQMPKQDNAPKKQEQKIEQEQKIVEKNVVEKQEPVVQHEQVNEQKIMANQPVNEESLELSSHEFEMLKKIDYLQKELVRVWHPPAIQKINSSCTIELFIDWKGVIENVQVIESSGIALFDAAARKAVCDIHIPEWAKGKSITIMLKA